MWKSPLSAKFLGHFSPIVPPSAAGFASIASDAGGLLWQKLERSKSLVLLQVGGLTCRWQRHSVKPSCWECSMIVEQAETHVRVVVPIEEEEEFWGVSLNFLKFLYPVLQWWHYIYLNIIIVLNVVCVHLVIFIRCYLATCNEGIFYLLNCRNMSDYLSPFMIFLCWLLCDVTFFFKALKLGGCCISGFSSIWKMWRTMSWDKVELQR
jgi:hypothetical protein